MPVDPTQINNTITGNIYTNYAGKITGGILATVLLAVTAWVVANFAGLTSVNTFTASNTFSVNPQLSACVGYPYSGGSTPLSCATTIPGTGLAAGAAGQNISASQQTVAIPQPNLVTTNTIGNPLIPGSVGQGAIYAAATRTGGYGEYGHILCFLTVTAALPSPQIDNCGTNWMTEENLTGGSAYGSWNGSVSPSRGLGQTFTAGALVAQENDVGNRWADFGFQDEPGGTRYTIAVTESPDVTPSPDGIDVYNVTMTCPTTTPSVFTLPANGLANNYGMTIYDGTPCSGFTPGYTYFVVNATTNTFQLSASIGGTPINGSGSAANVRVLPSWPGSFAHLISNSIHGHQFWTGIDFRYDTIVAGGLAVNAHGGSVAAGAPLDYLKMQGYWQNGLDLSAAYFSTFAAIKIGQFNSIVGGGYVGTSTNVSTNTSTGALVSAGGAGIAGNVNSGGYIAPLSGTVAAIAALTSVPVGARTTVTDATACTFNATFTGGGSTKCPAWYDGSVWRGG